MLSKNLLYKRIRQFALETPDWATAIRYHSKPDEKHDLTLIARRVYGLPNEWPVIMAAAAHAVRKDQFDAKTGTATETTAGILEVGTEAEVNSLTADDKVVTPAKLGNAASASFSANGYIKLPSWLGGLMVQWGRTAQGSYNENTVFAAGGFPTACYSVVVSPEKSGAVTVAGVNTITTTSFKVAGDYYTGATFLNATLTFYWIAIGR